MNHKSRLEELDALRGLAALAVVLYHYTIRYEELFGHAKTSYLSFTYGNLGVNLFFMISGFIIFMTITRTNHVKDFAKKRALRLYPAYIVAVIITFISVKIYGLEGRDVSYFEGFFNLTMLQGFIPGIKPVDGAYWSLVVELTFYIMIGLVLFFGLKKHIFKLLIGCLVASFFFQTLSTITDEHIIAKALSFYSIDNYIHLFIAGIMFYLIREESKTRYYILLVGCLMNQFLFNELIPSLITTLFFIIFYLLINNKLKILKIKPLTYLGAISYSWYLLHQNLGYIVIDIMERNGLVHEIFLVIPIFISIILATFLTYYVEKPIIKIFSKKMKRTAQSKEKLRKVLS